MNLSLKYLINEYQLVNKESGKEVYRDGLTNNLILFYPFDKGLTTEDIYNGIREEAYLYLINELNNKHNLVVNWTKIEGTSSDYTIHYDLNPNELIELQIEKMKEVLDNSIDDKHLSSKYTQVLNRTETSINFLQLDNELDVYFDTLNNEELTVLSMRVVEHDLSEVEYAYKTVGGVLKGKMFLPNEIVRGNYSKLNQIIVDKLIYDLNKSLNSSEISH